MSSATLQKPNTPSYIFRHSLLPVYENGGSDANRYIPVPTLSKEPNGIMYMSQTALARSVQQRTIEAIILFVRNYFIQEAEPSADKLCSLYRIESTDLERMLDVSLYAPENLRKDTIIEAADAAIKLDFPFLIKKCDLTLYSLLNSSTLAQPFDSSFVYMTERFLKDLTFYMDRYLPWSTIACHQSLAKVRKASRPLIFQTLRYSALMSSQAPSMKNGNDSDSSDDHPLVSPLFSNMQATSNSEKTDRENITSPVELNSELYVINKFSGSEETDQIEISKITSSPHQISSYSEISKFSPPSASRNERITCSSREAAQDPPPLAIYLDTFCKQENGQREYLYLSDEILQAAYKADPAKDPDLYRHVLEEYLSYNPHIKSLTLNKCSSLADSDILVLKKYTIVKLKIQNCPNITNRVHGYIASLRSVVQVEICYCDQVSPPSMKWIDSHGFSPIRRDENYYCVLSRRFLF